MEDALMCGTVSRPWNWRRQRQKTVKRRRGGEHCGEDGSPLARKAKAEVLRGLRGQRESLRPPREQLRGDQGRWQQLFRPVNIPMELTRGKRQLRSP